MNYNEEYILKLQQAFANRQGKYVKMYEAYNNKTKITQEYTESEFTTNNEVITSNFVNKLVQERVAYACGKPIIFKHIDNNENCIKSLEKNLRIQKKALFSDIFKHGEIAGTSYVMAYITDNGDTLKFKVVNAKHGIAYCDEEGNVELFLYFYKEELSDIQYMKIYTDEGIYDVTEDLKEHKPFKEYFFHKPPVIKHVIPDGKVGTIYNSCITLIDAMEKAISDYGNTNSDFRDCYFKIFGVNISDEDMERFKKLKAFILPNKDSDVDFLTKQANYEYCYNFIKLVEGLIYQATQAINSNESISANVSGTAILSRIINLRNRIQLHQQSLEDTIRGMLRVLFLFLKQRYNEDYDYLDLDIQMSINVPNDYSTIADIVSKLADRISDEDALSPFADIFPIGNGHKAVERKLQENILKANNESEIADISGVNLDKVGVGDETK
ncbi:phage portal protein [Clostridium beijerinckii]|uniref:SPP1 family phage portal protein n=1 Tax=Clostridium beijerinckii TaxID=1520 RepID=A0AAE5HB01_CLOBE|nr:phage portal protein [Clostridium beijerinckii]NSB17446.1 SPP1 family phage portal protein [Clostridium beijerinckii]OOM28443.1 phage portal protein, SPP1 Gp6-like [Clostridium beijerinckii]